MNVLEVRILALLMPFAETQLIPMCVHVELDIKEMERSVTVSKAP